MKWYTVEVAHDGMERGLIVRLYDTDDVKRRVAKGFLTPRKEPPRWMSTIKNGPATDSEAGGESPR